MALFRDFNSPSTQPLVTENLGTASGAKCAQCGKAMRTMPFMLKNITCRDCYGNERYRRSELDGTLHSSAIVAAPALPDEPVAS